MTTHRTDIFDRAKLSLTFDAPKMLADVEAMQLQPYFYYSPTIMKIPDSNAPYEDRDIANNDTIQSKYLAEVIDYFRQHTSVTLARILRLDAGSELKRHNDPMLGLEVENSVIRLTIPIVGSDNMEFYLNDQIVPMQHGECWYMKLSDEHWAINHGPNERINMTIDMEPNDWVRELIATGAKSAD